jgi:hypothetical protein
MGKCGRATLTAALFLVAVPAGLAEDLDSPAFTANFGARYWLSSGRTSWNHDATSAWALYGNPTSVLTYDDLTGHSGELFFDVAHETSWFVKGYVGLGGIPAGALDDEDYFTGQVKFLDTSSRVSGGSLRYASFDLGHDVYEDADRGLKVRAFLGYHYWNENVPAYGIQCNPDDVAGFFCGAPGSIPVPFSTKVITNDATWHSVRLGIGAEANLAKRWSISGEAAFIPYASLANRDSHHLRSDLGPTPNIRHNGTGIGVQLEAFVNYAVTPMWTVGLGARYWHLSATGDTRFGPGFAAAYPLNDFTSERYGLLLQTKLRF